MYAVSNVAEGYSEEYCMACFMKGSNTQISFKGLSVTQLSECADALERQAVEPIALEYYAMSSQHTLPLTMLFA